MKKILLVLLVSSTFIYSLKLSGDKNTPSPNKDRVEVEKQLDEFSLNIDLPSLQMYNAINKYSKEYNVPKDIAFAIAYAETGYKGPLHLSYNPSQTSVGAVGPMQIMPKTGAWIDPKGYNHTKLKNNIEYNVELSMKLCALWYKQYGNWQLTMGYYNTGYPKVNDYAIKTSTGTYKWINQTI